MVQKWDFKHSPSAEYCWLVKKDDEELFFPSEQAALEYATAMIPNYCDDGWSEEVEHIFIAKVTHTCEKANVVKRPDDSELDDDLIDKEGYCWEEFSYKCDYEMKAY